MKIKFLKITFLTLLVLFAFGLPNRTVQAAPGDILTTEIMYNPEGADTGGKVSKGTFYSHEWTEVHNASNQQIDLTDWRFNDGANHILNPPPEKGGQGSIVIQPGEYVILANDAATFLIDHPGFSGTVIDTVMGLNNTSDTLSLIDPDGNIVDSVTYQDSWGGDGNGKSLEKIESSGTNTADNWGESQAIGGTPGTTNSISGQQIPPDPDPEPVCQPTEEICDGIDNDCDGLIDEDFGTISCGVGACVITVESCVSGVAQICTPGSPTEEICDQVDNNCDGQIDEGNICVVPEPEAQPQPSPQTYPSGIFINEFLPSPEGPDADEEFIELYNSNSVSINLSGWIIEDTQGSTKSYTLPDGTNMSGYGFLLFYRSASKIVLNNDGEGLILKNPSGSIVDSVSYEGNAPQGQSYAKKFDGAWEWTLAPTPGQENSFPIPEPVEPESQPQLPETQTAEAPPPNGESQSSQAPSSIENQEGPEPETQSPQPQTKQEVQPLLYPSGVVLNEILPSPIGPDSQEEWVEIFNQNDFEVVLSNWQMKDTEGRIKIYTFPQGTKISPEGYFVLSRPTTKITLNNDGDGLILTRSNGEIVDQVSYEKATTGKSYNRTDNGWTWSDSLTPGSKNIIPAPPLEEGTEEEKKRAAEAAQMGQASIGQQFFESSQGLFVVFIALVGAVLSGIVILILKKKIRG